MFRYVIFSLYIAIIQQTEKIPDKKKTWSLISVPSQVHEYIVFYLMLWLLQEANAYGTHGLF